MITGTQILDYIQMHPNSLAKDIAAAFGMRQTSMSARLLKFYTQGRLTRAPEKIGLTGVTTYRYSFASTDTTYQKARKTTRDNVKPSPAKSDPINIEEGLKAVADSLVDALMGMVRARLVEQVGQIVQDVPVVSKVNAEELLARVRPPALAAPVSKLRPILIIGLLPRQKGEIVKDFHDVFDMRFWNDNENSQEQLRKGLEFADKVLLHTAHCSHSTQDTIRQKASSKLVFVSGAVSAMKDVLTSLYVEEVK
jgi:hypothetical protein